MCEMGRTCVTAVIAAPQGLPYNEAEVIGMAQVYDLDFREQEFHSIFNNGHAKVMQLSFPAGKVLDKHKTDRDLLVLVVKGEVNFTVDETFHLKPGRMLSVEAGTMHAVEALTDAVILLVLVPPADTAS